MDLMFNTCCHLMSLGHELVKTHPKHAVSWYTVGCYYWCVGKNKYEECFRYLKKATELDPRFLNGFIIFTCHLTYIGSLAEAWVALGHVLAKKEDSEGAVGAYRTACRLLPGDHRCFFDILI